MKRLFLTLALALSLSACKPATTATPALAPGAYNSTDATLYQALSVVQASLNSLKTTLADPKTEATTVSTLKPYVNQAIADYDIAEVAYQAYHAALATNAAASPATVQAALTKVQTDLQTTPKVNQ